MAKVLITIDDKADGSIGLAVEFFPEALKGKHTPAQKLAFQIAEAIVEKSRVLDMQVDADDEE